MKTKLIALSAAALLATGCATTISDEEAYSKAVALMKAGFKDRGQAKVDRIDQDKLQRLCSSYESSPVPKDVAAQIEKEQLATIKYPADGKLMGDWKAGEKLAQSGVGMTWSDAEGSPIGGNCYNCHRIGPAELSYGTLGPSLLGFGKVRGYTPEMQKYAYSTIYNAKAHNLCSLMPRFGQAGALSEAQIKDLVALLMDPASPVNK